MLVLIIQDDKSHLAGLKQRSHEPNVPLMAVVKDKYLGEKRKQPSKYAVVVPLV